MTIHIHFTRPQLRALDHAVAELCLRIGRHVPRSTAVRMLLGVQE